MIIQIPKVLSQKQVSSMRAAMETQSVWIDGNATAGAQAVSVKHNQQLDQNHEVTRQLGDFVLDALSQSSMFISAALPQKISPPMFNRCDQSQGYGLHVDNAIRIIPGTAIRLRTDLSATIFLSNPDDYDGGELEIQDKYGSHAVKLEAGDMILYSSTSLHRVRPVQSGSRVCAVFWMQSMVRDDNKREVLYDLDKTIQSLTPGLGARDENLLRLNRTYQNLLQQWSET